MAKAPNTTTQPPPIAAPAIAGYAHAVGEGRGVVATPLETLNLATVIVRKGQGKALAAKVKTLFKVTLEEGSKRSGDGAVSFVGTAPGIWIAVNENYDPLWVMQLAKDLEGLASVSDQSDGYAAIRLEGPRVVDVMERGVFNDLHISAFPVGAAGGFSVHHVGVVLWRRGETAFDIMSFRSYAKDLWHWIEESAAEFGLEVAKGQ
jgi:sarcosine oxidase subunit gamma